MANIGIASKDSSNVISKKNVFENLKTCVAAYKKKQEFEGGLIKLEQILCNNYYKAYDSDDFSKIYINNEDIEKVVSDNFKNHIELEKSNLDNINLINNYRTFHNNELLNTIIVTPKDTKKIWEVDFRNGKIKPVFFKGKPSKLNSVSFKYNLGVIPKTISLFGRGDDFEPLKSILLTDDIIDQGKLIQGKILGNIIFKDFGHEDSFVILVPQSSEFFKYNNLDHLFANKPNLFSEIKNWLELYKGENLVFFEKYELEQETVKLIKKSQKKFQQINKLIN